MTISTLCPLVVSARGGAGRRGSLRQAGDQGGGRLWPHVQVSPHVPEDGEHHGDTGGGHHDGGGDNDDGAAGGLPHHLPGGRLLPAELWREADDLYNTLQGLFYIFCQE